MSSSKTTTQSSTTTPTNPAWVQQDTQNFGDALSNLMQADPTNSVAGPTSLTSQMFGLGGALGGQGANWLNQAAGLAAGAGQAYGYNPAMTQAAQVGPGATAYGGIGNYLNPYTSDVANTTLQQLNQANQMALNDVGSGAILAGQYGGSRQGVAQGLTNSQFQQNAANALSNLNLQGFNTALGAANNDADRQQQSNTLQAQLTQQANLANQSANNQAWQYNAGANDAAASRQLQGAQVLSGLGQAGLGTLNTAAGVQQGIAQAQAAAPYTTLDQLAAAYSGLPLNLFHGQTANGTSTETSSDPLGSLGKVAGIAGALGLAPFTGGASLSALGSLGAAAGLSGVTVPSLAGGITALGGSKAMLGF